jgi:hypothetical protein
MRKLMLVVSLMCLCASLAMAQDGKVSVTWSCAKPAVAHSIDVGDQAGHAYTIDQIKCTTTNGEIAGVKEKEGTGTEFAEISGNRSTGHGVYVETLTNGDKIHYTYEFTGTLKDGQMTSGSNKWRATSGTGKFKGIKASGTCTTTTGADGGFTDTCNGTYSIPK